MLSVFAEQPLLISFMIGIVSGGLGFAWLQEGDKRFAIAAGVTVMLIPASYLLAHSIETDREKILNTIHATADAVEKNDHQTAVQVFSDPQARQRALQELPNYDVHNLSVRNIQIRFVDGSDPLQARVDLDAAVRASQAKGHIKNARVVRRVLLTFVKQSDDSWTVIDYTHVGLDGNPDNLSPR